MKMGVHMQVDMSIQTCTWIGVVLTSTLEAVSSRIPQLLDKLYVFSPLCVADPLAKKRASMYDRLLPAYMMTDPSNAWKMIYPSADPISPATTSSQQTYNEGL
jgi:hypothetical protein